MLHPGDNSVPDALETVEDVLQFLRESLCGARDVPFSNNALAGAQAIFFALSAEVQRIRELAIQQFQ